jgi:MFS family permease
MGRFRFSLAGLCAFTLVAGVALAAAREPTEPWANGAFSLALLVLGIALLGILFRRGSARAYWSGFALLGWGYMFLAFGPWCDAKVAPLLITKTVCEYLHFAFRTSLPTATVARQIPGTNLYMFGYQQIGHALTALLMGLLGGALARRFHNAETRPEPPPEMAEAPL